MDFNYMIIYTLDLSPSLLLAKGRLDTEQHRMFGNLGRDISSWGDET